MLIYSRSIDRVICISSLKEIAAAHLVKYYWNAPSRREELEYLLGDPETDWDDRLTNYREEVIRDFFSIRRYKELPRLIKSFLKESILLLYQAYRQMILWKERYDPGDGIYLPDDAPNYVSVDGEFNDIEWARSLMPIQPYEVEHFEFSLACFYWFERETARLWVEIQASGLETYNGSLIEALEEPLVALRIFQLENRQDLFREIPRFRQIPPYAGTFFEVGFDESVRSGYEYPTYYFWENMTVQQRIAVTDGDDSFFEYLERKSEEYPDYKIIYFLYSRLSEGRKNMLLDWTIEHESPLIWPSLLFFDSQLYSEIIGFIYRLPVNLYSEVLDFMVCKVKKYKLPFYIEAFLLLWSEFLPRITS